MKIAGRKNDGAWYRTNVAISKLTTADLENFVESLQEDCRSEGEDFIQAMNEIKSNLGLPDDLIAPDWEAYSGVLAETGIPRQLWLGKLSWDTYTKVDDVYKPDHAQVTLALSKKLRKFMTKWLFARRELADLGNTRGIAEGNPGGIANAEPDDAP